MKTIVNLAWANAKYHRSKNILSGIAIILTTILVYLIISIGIGSINVQNFAVNQLYPTFHGMYRDVSEETVAQLGVHDGIETMGLRQDVGEIELSDAQIIMTYLDQEAAELTKMELASGRAPQSGDEIALPANALEALGYVNAKLGDPIELSFQPYKASGLGVTQTQSFTLVGFLPNTQTTEDVAKNYALLVSKDFMTSVIPESEREYRAVIRLRPEYTTTVDTIENEIDEIGANFGISESNTVKNSDYLFANYVDPSFITGLIIIVMIILIAGALTIYSIYYVSLINKVQEFGKLRALGATKKQVRQAVLLENLLVALFAIPIGLVVSIFSVKLVFQIFLGTLNNQNELIGEMQASLNSGSVNLIIPWIIALTIFISLTTVIVSSLKPMLQASKIMPVEAMHYTGQNKSKAKKRKGFISLNLSRLVEANLSRNKKRTFITIFSLGLIGILFVVISTVLSCMNPAQIAQNAIAEDFRLSIHSTSGDQMHPEREWTAIQAENPLDNGLVNEIKALPGVEKIYTHQSINFQLPEVLDSYDNSPVQGFLTGTDEDQFKQLKPYLVSGQLDYLDYSHNDLVVATGYLVRNIPEIKVGSQLKFEFTSSDGSFSKVMTVGALVEAPDAYEINGAFLTSNRILEELTTNNLTYLVDIEVTKEEQGAVNDYLTTLTKNNDQLQFDSYDQQLKQWQSSLTMMSGAAYGIMIVLAVVGIMNLVNTTIDSIITRKKELGIMQALGMSNRQMRKMLQREGLVYAGGIIFLAVFVGSLLGYGVFLYAKANSLLQIRTYAFPFLQVGLLIFCVVLVQVALTFATTKIVSKESIIQRIHASE